jgi:hypothetical protein
MKYEDCIIIDNGKMYRIGTKPMLWLGHFSCAMSDGSIIHFIQNYLNELYNIQNINTLFILFQCDGNVNKELIYGFKELSESRNQKLIVGTLGQKNNNIDFDYLYLPLDDSFFLHGMFTHLNPNCVDWDNRKPIAFWRGECSGGGINSARVRSAKELIDYPHSDVKLTDEHKWSINKNIPSNLFVEKRVHFTEFFNYKIFLIIDGNVIASNHMWGFATGCVPMIISDATCWFQDFLSPFVNYIPIQYDLSDLKEKIDWVVNHDEEARQISKNALDLSKTIFTPTFQKEYLIHNINKRIGI